jgi:hypothetical protein
MRASENFSGVRSASEGNSQGSKLANDIPQYAGVGIRTASQYTNPRNKLASKWESHGWKKKPPYLPVSMIWQAAIVPSYAEQREN